MNISCNSWISKLSIQSISRISKLGIAPFLGTQKWVVAPFLRTKTLQLLYFQDFSYIIIINIIVNHMLMKVARSIHTVLILYRYPILLVWFDKYPLHVRLAVSLLLTVATKPGIIHLTKDQHKICYDRQFNKLFVSWHLLY